MPFSRLEQSKHAQSEDRRYRREPRTEQPDPPAVRRRPQILGQQRCRAKRHQVQFERQFEFPPSRALVFLRIEFHGHAKKPKQEGCPREIKVALPVKRQLIRSVVKIKRSTIPIDQVRGCVSRHEPVHTEKPARRCRCRQKLPPSWQLQSELDVSYSADQPYKPNRMRK